MSGASGFFSHLACVFAIIVVHECGHYLFGWLGGIPRRDMRIRLLTFPQHVVIRDGDEWISPLNLDRFVPLLQRHLQTTTWLFLFVAGGFLFETLVSVPTALIAKEMGWTFLARMIALQTLVVYLIYLILMDLPMALRKGHAWGDTSGLWFISRSGVVVLTLALLGIRVGLIWWVNS